MLCIGALAACTSEARNVGPTPPQTAPLGNADPRVSAYQDNFYQLSQGGRYFAWYGCAGCHTETAAGVLDLPDDRWRYGGGFADVYAAVADRHGGYAYRQSMPTEQLWQVTAYVRDLPKHQPEKRRRGAMDQKGEPTGRAWSGPL